MGDTIRVAMSQTQRRDPHHTPDDVFRAAVFVVVQERIEVPISSFQHQVHVRRALDDVVESHDRGMGEALQRSYFRIYPLDVALRLVERRVALDPFLFYRFAGELPGAVLALDALEDLRELALACASEA